MKGIRFVVDDKGRKVAVIIDLKRWGALLEDFFDRALAHEALADPDPMDFDEYLQLKQDSQKHAKKSGQRAA